MKSLLITLSLTLCFTLTSCLESVSIPTGIINFKPGAIGGDSPLESGEDSGSSPARKGGKGKTERYDVDPSQSSITLVAYAGMMSPSTKHVISISDVDGHAKSDGAKLVGSSNITELGMNSAQVTNLGWRNNIRTGLMKSKVLETGEYPNCSLEVTNAKQVGNSNEYDVTAMLSLMGVEKQESFRATISPESDGVSFRSQNFVIKKSDYGITAPVKLKDDIEIQMDLHLTPAG